VRGLECANRFSAVKSWQDLHVRMSPPSLRTSWFVAEIFDIFLNPGLGNSVAQPRTRLPNPRAVEQHVIFSRGRSACWIGFSPSCEFRSCRLHKHFNSPPIEILLHPRSVLRCNCSTLFDDSARSLLTAFSAITKNFGRLMRSTSLIGCPALLSGH
jgi:hypothetical protein